MTKTNRVWIQYGFGLIVGTAGFVAVLWVSYLMLGSKELREFSAALEQKMLMSSILSTSYSEDGLMKAVAFRQPVHPSNRPGIHVSILNRNEDVHPLGNVFVQESDWVETKWTRVNSCNLLRIFYRRSPKPTYQRNGSASMDGSIQVKCVPLPNDE